MPTAAGTEEIERQYTNRERLRDNATEKSATRYAFANIGGFYAAARAPVDCALYIRCYDSIRFTSPIDTEDAVHATPLRCYFYVAARVTDYRRRCAVLCLYYANLMRSMLRLLTLCALCARAYALRRCALYMLRALCYSAAVMRKEDAMLIAPAALLPFVTLL